MSHPSQRQRPVSDVMPRRAPSQQVNTDIDEEDDEDDASYLEPPRMPTSARRYQSTPTGQPQGMMQRPSYEMQLHPGYRLRQPVPPRRSRQPPPPGQEYSPDVAPQQGAPGPQPTSAQWRPHWLVHVGGGMLIMLVGWVLLSALLAWWQVWQDDLHYGRPRTSQYDAVVGHNDSPSSPSHFIALNLNRHVEVIELPGGDASKARIYLGPVLTGQGQDLAAVTLSFKDVNGDGSPDVVVSIQSTHVVFLNEQGSFRPQKPSDRITL